MEAEAGRPGPPLQARVPPPARVLGRVRVGRSLAFVGCPARRPGLAPHSSCFLVCLESSLWGQRAEDSLFRVSGAF